MIFRTPRLDKSDIELINEIEKLEANLRYLLNESPDGWQNLLTRNTFARSIQGSLVLEGFDVSVDDSIAAADRDQPFESSAEAWDAVMGYRMAMACVQQLAGDPFFAFSTDWVRSLHFMMLHHELNKNPGRWRAGNTVVRGEDKLEVLYEGPDARLVPELMEELTNHLEDAFAAGETHPLVLAAMAHLNLAMIHPFTDGNGRVARSLQALVLARAGGLAAESWSIEEFLGRNMKEYFRVLAETGGRRWNPERDATDWVRFILKAHKKQTATLLRDASEYERLWGILETQARNLALPSRLALALVDASVGHAVRNSSYRTIADVSDQVASRDLAAAVKVGLLDAEGDRRGRVYIASEELRVKMRG